APALALPLAAAHVVLRPLHPPPRLQVRHPRRRRHQVRRRGGGCEAGERPHHRPPDVRPQDAADSAPR
ncbi:hypothetical protein EE612_014860, partial [Oryza sativa]